MSNMARKWVRRLGGLALAVGFLSMAASGVVWMWLRKSLPQLSGNVTVAALSARVSIHRDAWGIPHVVAATEHDAFVALGYVQAQDRFFQMELRRRLAQGRLSEIAGASAVETDTFFRTMGFF